MTSTILKIIEDSQDEFKALNESNLHAAERIEIVFNIKLRNLWTFANQQHLLISEKHGGSRMGIEQTALALAANSLTNVMDEIAGIINSMDKQTEQP